ncbi:MULTISPECIES: recombinase family protein [Bacillus cereus group]|uniref:recombinase family protein n=1 Tax=Bacillus cereus group TaxID=86661 RepID=UPI0009926069|nr:MULTISPECIES: recombinase family protein [Bacillus cereus group]MBJ7984777.1 recombinase family protein [Bacillus cereus]MCU5719406.1 recombinase family protein [Bacillus cereus]OOR57151.1 integrase [Bacillus mycoides]
MIYGYARVSTQGQNLESQLTELKKAGAEDIRKEKASGKSLNRNGLNDLLNQLTQGDTLMVTKMDRIARNVREGIDLISQLNEKGIKLHVLNMGVFDGSPTSKLITNILLSVADWEREMLLERQRAGIEEAKKRGAYKGRAKKYTSKNASLVHALELYDNRDTNKMTMNKIAEVTQISRATLYRAIKEREETAN